VDRVYATDEERSHAITKAEELAGELGSRSRFPIFVKPMTQSHVTGGFWLVKSWKLRSDAYRSRSAANLVTIRFPRGYLLFDGLVKLQGLPTPFCRKHLPKRDETIRLEDEEDDEFETLYLDRKMGLSAGWRGFAIEHKLVDGDCLVFQLIERTKFKVSAIHFA